MNLNEKTHPLSRPGAKGLYDPATEKDSCGVGFVADMKGRPSREIVLEADHALRRMDHRGGCGCETNTGDGCGILTAIPHKFLKKSAKEAFGTELPEKGLYAVGNVFLPQDEHERAHCKATVEEFITMQGQTFIGWRDMNVQPEKADVGPTALASMPVIEQLYVGAAPGVVGDDFERQLYTIRKLATRTLRTEHDLAESDAFYICTLSSKVIVYKGMLTPDQLMPFYPDLQDEDYPAGQFIVVAGFADKRMGIVVDELRGQQDVVIKSLGKALAFVKGIAGAADLGNQKTILVLDLGSLISETLQLEGEIGV